VLKDFGYSNVSEDQINYMITGMDKDGNGKIDFDEFKESVAEFVRSV